MKKTTKPKIIQYYPDAQDKIGDIVARLWSEGVRVRVHSKPWLGRTLKTPTVHARVKGGVKMRKKVREMFKNAGIKVKLFWSMY